MQQQRSDNESFGRKSKNKLAFATRCLGAALVVILIFEFGVRVGNGKIVFGSNKSEQTSLPSRLDYSTVDEVYNALKNNYDGQLHEDALLDGLKNGLASSAGDPYTEYFNAKQAKDFSNELDGSFTGIGAELGQDANKNLIVIAPIDGFAAAKAGLRAQDVIVSIDGKSTSGLSIDEAVTRIRGPKDTKVTLKIVRQKSQELTYTITREDIKVPSVKSQTLDGNIGYMQIRQFSDDTSSLARTAAQNFKQQGVKGIILDLRDDPGGLLDSAVDVSSLWLPNGKTVLQEKRGGVVINTYSANGDNLLQGIPTIVLINEGSASAAEITAGALHDNGAARLLGAKSYGKGVVQQVINLSAGAELKVTTASWYRPNGSNINKKGITPDQAVTMTDDDYKNNRDPQKDAALQDLQQ